MFILCHIKSSSLPPVYHNLGNTDLVKHTLVQTRDLRAMVDGSSLRSLSYLGAEQGAKRINHSYHLMSIYYALSTWLSPLCRYPNSYNNEIVSIPAPILQMWELKPIEVKWLVQGHMTSQLLNEHFNSGLPDFKVWLLIIQGREAGERGRKERNIY